MHAALGRIRPIISKEDYGLKCKPLSCDFLIKTVPSQVFISITFSLVCRNTICILIMAASLFNKSLTLFDISLCCSFKQLVPLQSCSPGTSKKGSPAVKRGREQGRESKSMGKAEPTLQLFFPHTTEAHRILAASPFGTQSLNQVCFPQFYFSLVELQPHPT